MMDDRIRSRATPSGPFNASIGHVPADKIGKTA